MSENQSKQHIILHPKLPHFFWVYLVSQIPGFIIGLIIILLIFFGLIGALFAGSQSPNSHLVYSKISDSSKTNNAILVYNLEGAITAQEPSSAFSAQDGIYISRIKKDFTAIKQDTTIKNIVFRVNSPGGEVFASEILGDLIADLLSAKNISQGIFYFDSLAASGALLATYKVPQHYIFASPYGETGSIGVRMELPNIAGLADKVGYKQIVIKSGENKDIGSPFRDPTSDEIAYFQSQTDTIYNSFVQTVAQGRKLSVDQVKQVANGLVYFNDDAKAKGLVDEVAQNIQSAIEKSAQNSSLSEYDVIEIEKPTSLLDEFGISFGIKNFIQIGSLPLQTTQDSASQITSPLQKGMYYAIDERHIP